MTARVTTDPATTGLAMTGPALMHLAPIRLARRAKSRVVSATTARTGMIVRNASSVIRSLSCRLRLQRRSNPAAEPCCAILTAAPAMRRRSCKHAPFPRRPRQQTPMSKSRSVFAVANRRRLKLAKVQAPRKPKTHSATCGARDQLRCRRRLNGVSSTPCRTPAAITISTCTTG